MGFQSTGGLGTRILFLNILRSEQDRLPGVQMPVTLAGSLIEFRFEEIMCSENRESLRLRMFMYNHRRATTAIHRIGIWYVLDVHPVLRRFWRIGWRRQRPLRGEREGKELTVSTTFRKRWFEAEVTQH